MVDDRKPEDETPDDDDTAPQFLEEPRAESKSGKKARAEATDWEIDDEPENPWMRGLWMVILAVLFGVGQSILLLAAVLQFLWLLFGKEKNEHIAAFGTDLADWLARVALFQTGTTEEKPFPFARWGAED